MATSSKSDQSSGSGQHESGCYVYGIFPGDVELTSEITGVGDPPGKVISTADIGHESLEGMMLSPDGKWVAGVAHGGSTRPKDAPQFKPNGTVVLYRLDGPTLTKTSEAPIGAWSQGAAFSKDGKTLVVGNMIQKNLQVFKNEDGKLTDTGQTIGTVGGAAAVRASTGP